MIMQDNKKITPVYGNMRPVEVRLNHQRLAGWVEESKSGESVDFADTYNYEADVLVNGKSEQVQTVQGKNLLDINNVGIFETSFPYMQIIEGKVITHVTGWNGKAGYLDKYFTCFAGQIFYLKKTVEEGQPRWLVRFYDTNKVDISGTIGNFPGWNYNSSYVGFFTSVAFANLPIPENVAYFRLGFVSMQAINENIYNIYSDIIVSAENTLYEPFVPDSPSPDYPSPVVSVEDCNLISRTLNIVTNGNFAQGTTGWFGEAGTLTVTDNIAYLKGLGTQARIKLKQGNHLFQPENEVIYFKCKARVRDSMCTNIYIEIVSTSGTWYRGNHIKVLPQQDVWYEGSGLITLDATRFGNSLIYIQAFYADATTQKDKILEVQNVQTINLTAIFGPGNEPTKEWCDEHFARWQDKKSDSIPLPPLRKIGDVADSYNPVTGEYVQRIGKKVFDGTESVSFNDSSHQVFYSAISGIKIISGQYTPSICSHFAIVTGVSVAFAPGHACGKYGSYLYFITTGVYESVTDFKAELAAQYAAGTPVTVYYQLAEPVTTYLDPAPVPTYYPWTRIEQDGAVKGVIEATVKVME